MTLRMTPLLPVIAGVVTAWTPAMALETDPLDAPFEALGRIGVINQAILNGTVTSDDVAARVEGRGRLYYVGLAVDAYGAIGDDDMRGVDAFNVPHLRARVDGYVRLNEDLGWPIWLHLNPHYEFWTFPAYDNTDSAHWVGLDAWYLLPFQGFEVGASFDYDVGGEYGWYAEVGARQIFQNADAGLDIVAWQTIGYANEDYHENFNGVSDGNLTTLDLGARVTIPLPWQNTWAFLTAEITYWLPGDVRDNLADDGEFMIGIGFEYRIDSATLESTF